MGNRLEGLTAVVTGASTGIGRGVALRLAREGAAVAVHYRRSEEQARSLVQTLETEGRRAVAVQADVARDADIERLVAQSREQLGGRIDIWANIAGADILTGPAARLSDEEKLDRLLAVDLRGTMMCSWRVAALMKEAGSGVIINMSWDQALHGLAGRNPEMFAAVKGGVAGFSKSLARSVAPAVRVNVVAPGWIETAFAQQDMDADYYQWVTGQTPLGRFGRPDDVAGAVVYLASPEAGFITGQTLYINGGVVSSPG